MTDVLTPTKLPTHALAMNSDIEEKIFTNGTAFFDAVINDFNEAKESINFESYIFHKDQLGERIANALIKAAERGVKVRVLIDGAGSPMWSTYYARQLEAAGIQTKIFHPFPWQLWNWSRSVVKKTFLLKWIYLFLQSNSRNHRKVYLVDKKIAYIGSLNISKVHLDESLGGSNWRDTAVRLSNIDLSELATAFNYAWDHRTIKERVRDAFKHVRRDPIIRLNYTRHRRRILYKHLLRRIARCQRRIWITNAYFIPDNFLLRRLKEAASRGVDVRILLPEKSDVMVMPWASSTFYESLLKDGVKIYEYLPSVLHAKTIILDDWVLVGSSNLNSRSLLHDLEIDIKIAKPTSAELVVQQFLNDLDLSREISLTTWKYHRPLRQRALGRLVLYIKYWI
jgi:cardiolipin synthase A/B